MNTILIWAGALLALTLYYPLISGISRGEIKQSFATWILWVTLDVIALVSILYQKGNYLILVSYCIGGSVVTLLLLIKQPFKWTWFETFVTFLVIICLIVWKLSGSKMATIASTLAVVISGFPQFLKSWQKPDKKTGCIYLGYTLANFLSFLGGQAWTIEERFYPGACVILCFSIALAALRREDRKLVHVILKCK